MTFADNLNELSRKGYNLLHTKSFFSQDEDEQHINATYSQAPKTKYDDDLEKNHQNFKNGTQTLSRRTHVILL